MEDCQSRLLDDLLNSLIEKYKSLASINERLARAKLGKENIVALRERLISTTVLLNGFVPRLVLFCSRTWTIRHLQMEVV